MSFNGRFRWLVPLLLLGGLACNLLAPATPAPGPPPSAPPEDEVPEVSAPGPVASLQGVRRATVRIVAQGTFVPPEIGEPVEFTGSGSGFLIDPSGLAVTNNHVVTGAGLLQVYVGEEDTPRNARVLGVSECSDLAVIDIDGDDFPYLAWYEGPVQVGMEVYAAGFPLGEPEFTLTKGIISKEQASGETFWSSVERVIGHDATINPGNSGGPLVTPEGLVVGVNYRGRDLADQYFAIGREEAQPILEQLRQGRDVTSIGVNGVAVVSEDGSLSGVWVSGVRSGSAADRAGLQPGDLITALEGVRLARQGTLEEYCDVLRSHRPEDTLSLEVLRWSSGEVLSGQLNGRALEASTSFAGLASDVGGTGAVDGYSEYMLVTDDYGSIQMEVPGAWSEVDGSAWVDGGEVIGASLVAAPDLEGFLTTWSTPGVAFSVSDDLAKLGGYIQLLDIVRETYLEGCELDGRYDYQDPLYRGRYDLFRNCGGAGGSWALVLSAVPIDEPQAFLILVEVVMVTDADVDALERILDTFQVVGPLP